jgi:hypothetical protein
MTDTDADIEDALAAFHHDVPHQFHVSLTMSVDVRDDVSAVRDELNDLADGSDVTTNDVMRLALAAAARYPDLAAGDASLDDVDREQLLPLTSVLSRVLDED